LPDRVVEKSMWRDDSHSPRCRDQCRRSGLDFRWRGGPSHSRAGKATFLSQRTNGVEGTGWSPSLFSGGMWTGGRGGFDVRLIRFGHRRAAEPRSVSHQGTRAKPGGRAAWTVKFSAGAGPEKAIDTKGDKPASGGRVPEATGPLPRSASPKSPPGSRTMLVDGPDPIPLRLPGRGGIGQHTGDEGGESRGRLGRQFQELDGHARGIGVLHLWVPDPHDVGGPFHRFGVR